MTEEKIREVVSVFAMEARKLYGFKLQAVILYGSCARGDFEPDSDIDILLLLDVTQEAISQEQAKIFSVSDKLDWEYDVVLTPVLQSYQTYQQYKRTLKFYQNIEREGVKIV